MKVQAATFAMLLCFLFVVVRAHSVQVQTDDGLSLSFSKDGGIEETLLDRQVISSSIGGFFLQPFAPLNRTADAPSSRGQRIVGEVRATSHGVSFSGELRTLMGVHLYASFVNHRTHLAIDAHLLSHRPLAASLTLTIPLQGKGWLVGVDPDISCIAGTSAVCQYPNAGHPVGLQGCSRRHGRSLHYRQRNCHRTRKREDSLGAHMVRGKVGEVHGIRTNLYFEDQEHYSVNNVPPFASDFYPFHAALHPDRRLGGLAIGTPTGRSQPVTVTRAKASSTGISITFDTALSPACARFNSSANFSVVLYRFGITNPAFGPLEPFRTALSKYYDIFEGVYAESRAILDQGNWLPFQSTIAIDDSQDFGFKFQEGGSSGAAAVKMNHDHVGIYPYVEPHVMHWPVRNASMNLTYNELVASVYDCIEHAAKYNTTHNADSEADLCQEIVASAIETPDGKWFWRVELAPWNTGAMLYAGLSDVNANRSTRPAHITHQILDFYRDAAAGNYSISGVYLDSVEGFGAMHLLNYRQSCILHSQQQLFFDRRGVAAALFAADEMTFLRDLANRLQEHGDKLFGNAMYIVPHIQFASVFDISGVETAWMDDKGTWTPTPHWSMAVARVLSGQRPYIYLMDAPFAAWTKESTRRYFDLCLLRGIWPSFFSANAFGNLYFENSTYYNRDRPLFKQYMPIFHAITAAGWQPIRHAYFEGTSTTRLFMERWGPSGNGTIYFTIRDESHSSSKANVAGTGVAPVTVVLNAAALGFPEGETEIMELLSGRKTTMSVDSSKHGAIVLDRDIFPVNLTCVLAVGIRDFHRTDFDIRHFGAVSGSAGNNTAAIQSAVDAATVAGGGRVIVPPGVWISGSIHFRGKNLVLELAKGATLRGITPPSPAEVQFNYPAYTGAALAVNGPSALVTADGAINFTIRGQGTIDGNGAQFWVWNNLWPGMDYNNQSDPSTNPYGRPSVLRVINSTNVRWENFRVTRSAFWATQVIASRDVLICGVRIHVNDSNYCTSSHCYQPTNEDGIDIASVKDITIRDSEIYAHDDAIAVMAGMNWWSVKGADINTERVLVENCTLTTEQSGVAFDTAWGGGGNISDVIVRHTRVAKPGFVGESTQYIPPQKPCKLRVVPWLSPLQCPWPVSGQVVHLRTEPGTQGIVERVMVDNIEVGSVMQILFLAACLGYDPTHPCPQGEPITPGERLPVFRHLVFQNIQAEYVSQTPFTILGLARKPFTDIKFKNITVEQISSGARAGSCQHAQVEAEAVLISGAPWRVPLNCSSPSELGIVV